MGFGAVGKSLTGQDAQVTDKLDEKSLKTTVQERVDYKACRRCSAPPGSRAGQGHSTWLVVEWFWVPTIGIEVCVPILTDYIGTIEYDTVPGTQQVVKSNAPRLVVQQDSDVAERNFWKTNFVNLKCLYLHNNLISEWDGILGLCGAPKLISLTMFGNSISAHQRYRHFMVNHFVNLICLEVT